LEAKTGKKVISSLNAKTALSEIKSDKSLLKEGDDE